jgi:ABC-type Na+ efflux pump permease subunit
VGVDQVRLVAAAELRDYLRHPQALRDLVLLPLLLLMLAFVPLAFVVDRLLASVERTEFDLVVEGDLGAAPGLAEHLAGTDFTVAYVDDAAAHVRDDRSLVGLRIEPPPDDAGPSAPPLVTIVAFDPEGGPRYAIGALRLRLWQWSQDVTAAELDGAGADPDLARPLEVAIDAFAGTPAGTRMSVGFALPALLVFQLSALATATVGRVGPRRGRQVLEPQLVLPLRRWVLAAGKGVAGAVIGLVGSLALLVLLGVPLVAVLTLAGGGPRVPITAAPGVAAGALSLAALFTTAGLALGLRARSESEETFASLAVVFGAVGGVALLLAFEGHLPDGAAWVPGLGAVAVIRGAILGGSPLGPTVLGVVTTLAAAGVLLALAARRLDDDRQVLRWR